ncbi:MAG: flagellar export protein FliJ [bacterium]|nr:flagellar export protein FliJ [bacterium]
MKRFVFRLESVLKLRRHELELCQRALGSAQERYKGIEQAMEAAGGAAAERAAEWIARARVGVVSERMRLSQFGVEQAYSVWREDQRRLEEARLVAEQMRHEVAQAHTRVRALEKLREHALERHRLESQREEARDLDEVASRRRPLATRFTDAWDDVRREAS